MKRDKHSPASITRQQVAAAAAKFRAAGGIVTQLPPERANRHSLVGRRWSQFEEITVQGSGVLDQPPVQS